MTDNEHQYGTRGGNGMLWLALTALAIGCLAVFLQNKFADNPSSGPRDGQAKSLTVYCAAGVRLAVEEAAKQFENEMGVTVKLEYANSGVLANRLKMDKKGGLAIADVYIPADYSYTEKAAADGLTRESLRVATWQVVLGVKSGANIDVNNCDDVLSSNLSFVICDPLAGVGKKTKKMLEQSGHWTAINKAKASSFPTVTEAALAVKENAGTQAAFVWDSVARQHGLRVIELPELKASRANISVAVTASTDRPTLALQFARFLAAPSKGGLSDIEISQHCFALKPHIEHAASRGIAGQGREAKANGVFGLRTFFQKRHAKFCHALQSAGEHPRLISAREFYIAPIALNDFDVARFGEFKLDPVVAKRALPIDRARTRIAEPHRAVAIAHIAGRAKVDGQMAHRFGRLFRNKHRPFGVAFLRFIF